MSQCDITFNLKINVGHSGLYSTVQWFCLISWRLFGGWTSCFCFENESVWPSLRPQSKYRCALSVCHGPLILSYFLKAMWWMNIILWDYESVSNFYMKAFLKSKKVEPTSSPLSILFSQLSTSFVNAVLQDWCLRKPDWDLCNKSHF